MPTFFQAEYVFQSEQQSFFCSPWRCHPIGEMWKSMAEKVSDPKVTTLEVKPLGPSAVLEIGTVSLKTKGPTPQEISSKFVVVCSRQIFGTTVSSFALSEKASRDPANKPFRFAIVDDRNPHRPVA
jgi:hypothetical protein